MSHPNVNKAVLLAAGIGSRLRPLTDHVPKCLVEIAGKPLLEYWFDALGSVGVRDVLINTHHLAAQVHRFLDLQRARGFRVQEAHEDTLLGSAGTIAANREWAQDADHVLIIYPDNLSNIDLSKLLARHVESRHEMTVLLFNAENPSACGIATLDQDDRITAFVEKPAQPQSNLANGGVYAVSADCWRAVADMRARDIGFDVLPRLVGRMHGYLHTGYHRDIGSLEALQRARCEASQEPGILKQLTQSSRLWA
jgi:mannose-1-phosphate guanylyltransferase